MFFRALLGAALAATAFGAPAQRYALEEFDVAMMDSQAGTVEAVRETPVPPRHAHAFGSEVIELTVRPQTLEEVVIRLDSGPIVTLEREPGLRVRLGQRVRVTLPP